MMKEEIFKSLKEAEKSEEDMLKKAEKEKEAIIQKAKHDTIRLANEEEDKIKEMEEQRTTEGSAGIKKIKQEILNKGKHDVAALIKESEKNIGKAADLVMKKFEETA